MALKSICSGAAKGAQSFFSGTSNVGAKLSERFDDLMFISLKIVAIGVACLAVYKYSGLRSGGDELAWYMLFGLGICAVGFEYYGAQTIVDGWFDRSFAALTFGALLCIPALGLSYSNAISSAAVQQSNAAAVQKANFRKTKNTENGVKELEFALKTAQDARSKMQPQRSAADARAVLDSSQAHKWWNGTDQCTKTKGPQTRKFCDDYRSAQADLKLWDDISTQDARIDAVQAKLEDARKAEGEAPTTVSEVRADTLEYAAWFGTDADHGQVIQARHIALTITLFVTFTGFLTGWKRNRHRTPKSWGLITALRRKWHVLWNGSEEGFVEPQPRGDVFTISMVNEEEAKAKALERVLAKMREQIKIPGAVAATA